MTSTVLAASTHPMKWTETSASSCFPAPIRYKRDLPVAKLLEDLNPRWLNGGAELQQAMVDACRNLPPDAGLRVSVKLLRDRQITKLWPGHTHEGHTTTFCTSWLDDLNMPRALRRYRNRFVYISQSTIPHIWRLRLLR